MGNLLKSLQQLFISKVRIKVLKYFLFNPDTPIHLRGAVRELKEEINAVRREIARLEEIKLLIYESRGNRKYYSINPDHPFITDFLGMFHKCFGIGGMIVEFVEKLGEVQFAILTSSFTTRKKIAGLNVDLVLIGQINLDYLGKLVEDAEKKLGREINYTVLKGSEFILRKKRRDAFIIELLMDDKILLVGKNEDLLA